MDIKQVALKLVLDGIGEDNNISNVDDRLRLQKAVYLSQAVGVNLGYHYSWYVKGPYSPALTQDYYRLNEALSAGDSSHQGMVLNQSILEALPRIRALLSIPAGIGIPKHSWYESLASVHYLVTSSGYSVDKAKEYLASVKPHIVGYFDATVQHLRNSGLIAP